MNEIINLNNTAAQPTAIQAKQKQKVLAFTNLSLETPMKDANGAPIVDQHGEPVVNRFPMQTGIPIFEFKEGEETSSKNKLSYTYYQRALQFGGSYTVRLPVPGAEGTEYVVRTSLANNETPDLNDII